MMYTSTYGSPNDQVSDALIKELVCCTCSSETSEYIRSLNLTGIKVTNDLAAGTNRDSVVILIKNSRGQVVVKSFPYHGNVLHIEKDRECMNMYNVYSTASELDRDENVRIILDQVKIDDSSFSAHRRLSVSFAFAHNILSLYSSKNFLVATDEQDMLEIVNKKDVYTTNYTQSFKSRSHVHKLDELHPAAEPVSFFASLFGGVPNIQLPYIGKVFESCDKTKIYVYTYGGTNEESNISRSTVNLLTNQVSQLSLSESQLRYSSLECVHLYSMFCDYHNRPYGTILSAVYDGKLGCINYLDEHDNNHVIVLEKNEQDKNTDVPNAIVDIIIEEDFNCTKCVKAKNTDDEDVYILMQLDINSDSMYYLCVHNGKVIRQAYCAIDPTIAIILMINGSSIQMSENMVNSMYSQISSDGEEDDEEMEDLDFEENQNEEYSEVDTENQLDDNRDYNNDTDEDLDMYDSGIIDSEDADEDSSSPSSDLENEKQQVFQKYNNNSPVVEH